MLFLTIKVYTRQVAKNLQKKLVTCWRMATGIKRNRRGTALFHYNLIILFDFLNLNPCIILIKH